MTTLTRLSLLPIVASLAGCVSARPFSGGSWIDLSYDYSDETLYWPTSDPFELRTVFDGVSEGGYYYSAYAFSTAEHGGTHVDAPVHFAAGKLPVDRVPLEHLIGDAVVVDVSRGALANRDYQVPIEDFSRWEAAHGRIPRGAIVLLRTGYGRFWPDPVRYMGTDRRGAEGVRALRFPGLHPDAAEWLVTSRGIKAVGIDTPSIDHGQSKGFETHRILAARDVPIFENVANLDRMPETGAVIVALPMKIRGGSGAPVRIAAWVP